MLKQIKIEDVSKSYNGKTGCMCGCNGTYSLKDAADIPAANKECGWDAYDSDSVRPRAVATAVRKVNAAIEAYGERATPVDGGVTFSKDGVWFHACAQYVAIDYQGRNTTVYLKEQG